MNNIFEILKSNKYVNVKCFKWLHSKSSRKYDEMFDYDTKEFIFSEFNISEKGTIVDNFKSLKFLDNQELECNYEESEIREFINFNMVISKITKHEYHNEFSIMYNKFAYIVCKYYEDKDENLIIHEGRIIKIGKFLLKNLMFNIEGNLKFCCNVTYFNNDDNNENISCKICFNFSKDMISICNCKGSLKYIHIQCLEKWINSKSDIEYKYIGPNYFNLILKNFYCEICKKTFPLALTDNEGTIKHLISSLKTKRNFIIFKKKLIKDEHSSSNFENEYEKIVEYMYIEFPGYKNLSIGRDKISDIQLDDISVSRRHSALFIDKDKRAVKIKDINSKFGTLLNMKEDIIITETNYKATVQKGNSVYHFKLKNKFN